jgi:hypothetical protein
VDSADNLHALWIDESPGNAEIFYKKGTPSGGSIAWGQNKRVSWTTHENRFPSVAVDSFGRLHALWFDETPGDVYYKKSTNGGATWIGWNNLTGTSALSYSSDMAIDLSDCLHVVWSEGFLSDDEICYKKGPNSGATWTTRTRLTWLSGDSNAPVIAVDPSDNLHVIWYDNGPGNYEIYYKKFIK